MNFLIIGKTPKAYFLSSQLLNEGHLVYLCIEKLDRNYTFERVIFYDYSNQIEILKFILKKEINLVIIIDNDIVSYELGDFLIINGVNVFRIQKELRIINSNIYNQINFFKECDVPVLRAIFFEKEAPAFNFLKRVNYPVKITAGNDEESYIVSGFLNSKKCIQDMYKFQYKNLLIEENYSGEEIFLYFVNDGVSLYLIGEVYEDLDKNQIISPIPFLTDNQKEKIIKEIILKVAITLNSINSKEHACIFGVKLLVRKDKVYALRILDCIKETHFINIITLLNENISDLIISSYSCSLSDDFYEVRFKNKYALTYKCQENDYKTEYTDNVYRYFKIDNENYVNMEGSTLAWLKSYIIENLV